MWNYLNLNKNYVQTHKHLEERLVDYVKDMGPKRTVVNCDSGVNSDVFRLAMHEIEDEKYIKIVNEKDGVFEIDFTASFMRKHNL